LATVPSNVHPDSNPTPGLWYEAGVKLISTITNAYISVIQTAVTKIVNAFQAFVTWAVEFFEGTIFKLHADFHR
jgi:hypothetical protein